MVSKTLVTSSILLRRKERKRIKMAAGLLGEKTGKEMVVNHRDQEADKIMYYHSQRSHLHKDCMSYEAFLLVDLREISGDVQFRSPTGDEKTSSTLFQTV